VFDFDSGPCAGSVHFDGCFSLTPLSLGHILDVHAAFSFWAVDRELVSVFVRLFALCYCSPSSHTFRTRAWRPVHSTQCVVVPPARRVCSLVPLFFGPTAALIRTRSVEAPSVPSVAARSVRITPTPRTQSVTPLADQWPRHHPPRIRVVPSTRPPALSHAFSCAAPRRFIYDRSPTEVNATSAAMEAKASGASVAQLFLSFNSIKHPNLLRITQLQNHL
jgi:hypothetical protein